MRYKARKTPLAAASELEGVSFHLLLWLGPSGNSLIYELANQSARPISSK